MLVNQTEHLREVRVVLLLKHHPLVLYDFCHNQHGLSKPDDKGLRLTFDGLEASSMGIVGA
jgi:hypothetical protein